MALCPTCGCDPSASPSFCGSCQRADETVMTVFREARHERQRFQLRRFDELKIGTERPYLVKGLIPRTGLVVAWGPPKCGKSFWTFDLTLHIALGREYRGRRVQQGPTVYCAFEGGGGYNARAEAFRKRYRPEDTSQSESYSLIPRTNLWPAHPRSTPPFRP